jgi:hypothetical protein
MGGEYCSSCGMPRKNIEPPKSTQQSVADLSLQKSKQKQKQFFINLIKN